MIIYDYLWFSTLFYTYLHFSIFIYTFLLSMVFSIFLAFCYSLYPLHLPYIQISCFPLFIITTPPLNPPPHIQCGATIRNRRSRFLLFCKERSDLQNPLFAMNCNKRSEICKNCKNKDRFVQIASFCKNIVKILQILQKRFAKILQKLYF